MTYLIRYVKILSTNIVILESFIYKKKLIILEFKFQTLMKQNCTCRF